MTDAARVSVTVAVPPEAAFEIFTRDIDQWWQRGPKFRHSGAEASTLYLEPHLGGRLLETRDEVSAAPAFEIGQVRVWEPPHRLIFSWRNLNYAPDETTEVEVEFVAAAAGTLVTVTHRGLAALRADHPARHQQPPPEFVRLTGLWWGDQMTALRRRCATIT